MITNLKSIVNPFDSIFWAFLGSGNYSISCGGTKSSAFICVSFLIPVPVRMGNAIIYNLYDDKNEQC